jgi:nitrogen fixation protein FixH
MKPRHFVVLAILAVVTTVAAIAAYAANNTWVQAPVGGARAFPSLAASSGNVAAIEIRQGEKTLTIERKDNAWRIKERGGYPVQIEKVRALMVNLAEANLVEAKTRVPDRYSLIELEDPTGKDAKSRNLRLLDDKGGVIAEAVIGKKRSDAFGYGKPGTYLRKPGDAQTWLTNVELDASTALRDWIKTDLFQTDSSKISRVSIELPGEQALKVERNADKKLVLVGVTPPQGQKLKDESIGDTIARATAYIDFEDVRKLPSPVPDKDVSTVKVETEGGLAATLRLRKDGDGQWVSLTAAGEGDAKKAADDINARTSGWEYKISQSKADSLSKRRADLFEKADAPQTKGPQQKQ